VFRFCQPCVQRFANMARPGFAERVIIHRDKNPNGERNAEGETITQALL